MLCCCVEPPDDPHPIVNAGTPYVSMKCSFVIAIVSVPTRLAAAAEGVDQAEIPIWKKSAGEPFWARAKYEVCRRIVKDRDLINAPIDRAGLDADHEWDPGAGTRAPR